jgi:hypothetical protein
MNKLGVAVVALHHHKKGKGADNAVSHEQMRGAGEIAAQADLIASIDQVEGVYRFRTTKNRHYGDDEWLSIDYRIENTPDGDIHLRQAVEGLTEYQNDKVLTNRILEFVNRPVSLADLSGLAGVSSNELFDIIEDLKDAGLVKVTPDGKFLRASLSGVMPL